MQREGGGANLHAYILLCMLYTCMWNWKTFSITVNKIEILSYYSKIFQIKDNFIIKATTAM